MAISQDGTHKFGLLYPTATGVDLTKGFILESFTRSETSNRVDLNDGNGEPLDTVVVPQRRERSFTMQIGTTNTSLEVGDLLTVDNGSSYYILTDVTINETQEDFVRVDATGYIPTNGARPFKFKTIDGGANYELTNLLETYSNTRSNKTSKFSDTIDSTDAVAIQSYGINSSVNEDYVFYYTSASGTLDVPNCTFSAGVSLVSSTASYIMIRLTSSAVHAEIGLKFA